MNASHFIISIFMVPPADNPVRFEVSGGGGIAGVDNGCQTCMEPFKADSRKAFNGICLVAVRSSEKAGKIVVKAVSEG